MSKIYIAAVQYDNGEEYEDWVSNDKLLGVGITFNKAVDFFTPHIEARKELYKKVDDNSTIHYNLLGNEDNVTIYAKYKSVDPETYFPNSSYVYYVIEMEVSK